MNDDPLSLTVSPDWEAFLRCIRREGTPKRVHHIELFLDAEVQDAIIARYGLLDGLDEADPFFELKRQVRLQRFLGYDYVRCGLDALDMPLNCLSVTDSAELQRRDGRAYMNEHKGPITTWDEFEAYPWPDPAAAPTRSLEWYQTNLPDDMCIIGSGGFGHFAEYLTWLMGYETLCYAIYDQPDLVDAMFERSGSIQHEFVKIIAQFDRVACIWGSDDMGFRTGPLISPDDLREFVLPGHALMARMSHEAGRPYALHSCGDLRSIMDDLLNNVGIDARHSFEDVIEPVVDANELYGDRIALLGGIDVDFLCRAGEQQIRARVRDTLEKCLPGGGYCLGSGNSIANYVPLQNYLTMLDEGRKFKV